MSDDFRPRIKAFAERLVTVAARCTNEESTKLFLILPFLNFLGYDDRNPDEVCPEHSADFSEKFKNRVDFAILKSGTPIIAIECKAIGSALRDERGQLRSYFNAAPTIKMGVLTDGIVYEFYADSDEPNMMDQNAFLSLDMREIAKGKIEDSVEDGLKSLQKSNFDPENIGAEAKRKLIFHDFVQQINTISENPSEQFVRLLLQNAGLSHVRAKSLADYTDLARSAFREFVNLRILQRLDLPTKEKDQDKPQSQVDIINIESSARLDETLTPSPLDNELFTYVKKRLAFLIKDDTLFNELDGVESRKFKGKFVVYYRRERAGRLFEFYEGRSKKYQFDFGAFGGEVITDKLSDIDKYLLSAFLQRVSDAETPAKRVPVTDELDSAP
jgi:predicted type IV restriction endonuclease